MKKLIFMIIYDISKKLFFGLSSQFKKSYSNFKFSAVKCSQLFTAENVLNFDFTAENVLNFEKILLEKL